ncbi:MAG TPA: hypothetical protein DCY59_08250, partial [Micrococcaceae bacterium]|nr:hypothetical protein [Micrococcaceae bacterium]
KIQEFTHWIQYFSSRPPLGPANKSRLVSPLSRTKLDEEEILDGKKSSKQGQSPPPVQMAGGAKN